MTQAMLTVEEIEWFRRLPWRFTTDPRHRRRRILNALCDLARERIAAPQQENRAPEATESETRNGPNAVAATPQAAVPVPLGWNMVPKKPTQQMLDALNSMAQCEGYIEEGYERMLAAAPAAPSAAPDDEVMNGLVAEVQRYAREALSPSNRDFYQRIADALVASSNAWHEHEDELQALRTAQAELVDVRRKLEEPLRIALEALSRIALTITSGNRLREYAEDALSRINNIAEERAAAPAAPRAAQEWPTFNDGVEAAAVYCENVLAKNHPHLAYAYRHAAENIRAFAALKVLQANESPLPIGASTASPTPDDKRDAERLPDSAIDAINELHGVYVFPDDLERFWAALADRAPKET